MPAEEWDLAGNIKDHELDACVIYELARLKVQLSEELQCRLECALTEKGYLGEEPLANAKKCVTELTTINEVRVFHTDTASLIIDTPWRKLDASAKARLIGDWDKAAKEDYPALRLSEIFTLDAIKKISAPANRPAQWLKPEFDWHFLFQAFSHEVELKQSALSRGESFMGYGFAAIDFNRKNEDILKDLKNFLDREREELRKKPKSKRGRTRSCIKDMHLKRITAARLLEVGRMNFKDADNFYSSNSRLKKHLFLNDEGSEWSRAKNEAIELTKTVFQRA